MSPARRRIGRRRVHTASWRRAGRLVPRAAPGLRARAVILPRGGLMDWHSTERREELIIALAGTVALEVLGRSGRRTATRLGAGRCAFLGPATVHRVVNRSRAPARYLYVTAPAS